MNEFYKYGLEGLGKESGNKIVTDEQMTNEDQPLPKTDESQNNVDVEEILNSFSPNNVNYVKTVQEKYDDIDRILDSAPSGSNVVDQSDSIDINSIMNGDKELEIKKAEQAVEAAFKNV